MKQETWYLQLFAEGISGEASAADAGQQSVGEDPARANNTQAAAANPTRLTWEQILADPEYNRQMQATIRARLKAAQQGWERKYAAHEAGTDAPIAQEEKGERIATAPAAPPNDRGADMSARIRQHYDRLVDQEARLKQVFPDFSLQQALRDPAFVHLTAPHVGVSVENAYYLCNRQKHQAAAMQLAARKTAEKLANAVRSGTYRPVENGTAPQAPAVTSFDYTHANAQQRQALKNAIRRSASRGEKIYPTEFR